MSDELLHALLAPAEHAPPEERAALLCHLGGRRLVLDAAERNGAIRRALLLLAAGGDPRRPLELDGRAVASIAADLDDPGRRATLVTGLRELDGVVAGLPALEASLAELVADPARAWESYALSLLAGALGEDDDDA